MQRVLNQLLPFNESRFDACMAYLSAKHSRDLTQYDMVKLHVMTDIFHALEHGKPVIGGALDAWQFGPLVEKAYNRVRRWRFVVDETGEQPEFFEFVGQKGAADRFRAREPVNDEDLSPSEVKAMTKAWDVIMSLDWSESQDYFHSDSTFIGRAWKKAREARVGVDWDDIIDEYDRQFDENHAHIKRLVRV